MKKILVMIVVGGMACSSGGGKGEGEIALEGGRGDTVEEATVGDGRGEELELYELREGGGEERGFDAAELADVEPEPEPWFEPLSVEQWLELANGADAEAFAQAVEKYDGPVCEGERCILVTFLEGLEQVFIRGEFNGWELSDALFPVAHSPGWWYWVLEDYPFDDYAQYKLFSGEEWSRDPMNRWVRFSDMAVNSAFCQPGVSRLAMVEDVYSPQLGNKRKLYVYVPAAAFADPAARFPVLYMQDGFNVFENPMAPFGSWDVDVSSDALFASGGARPVLIVGITTNDRFNEYIHAAVTINIGVPVEVTPKLDQYGEFVVETVVELIESRFPALGGAADRGIAGSSLGGSSSLYIAWRHPEVFGLVGSLSGSFWLGEPGSGTSQALSMREIVDANPPGPAHLAMRVYLDSGDSDGGASSYSNDNRDVTDWIRNKLISVGFANRLEWDDDGVLSTPPVDFPSMTDPALVPALFWSPAVPAAYGSWEEYLRPELNLLHLVGAGHEHDEGAWGARFPEMVRYLFWGG